MLSRKGLIQTQGVDSAYKRGGDAHRLAQGCKFRILVSLKVFQAKRHHIQPRRSCLGLHVKKYKNMCIFCALIWSLLGVKEAWATPGSVSFRGLIQNFRRASPPLSYVESPLLRDSNKALRNTVVKLAQKRVESEFCLPVSTY